MLQLNNILLNASGILEVFIKEVLACDQSINPTPLTRFREKLARTYGIAITPAIISEGRRISPVLKGEEVTGLEQALIRAFRREYPEIRNLLRKILSMNEMDIASLARAEIAKKNDLGSLLSVLLQTQATMDLQHAFRTFESHYGYFDGNEEGAFLVFTQLAQACRKVIVLIENSATGSEADRLSAEYAYKLMTTLLQETPTIANSHRLFDMLSKQTTALIRKTNAHGKPYHDVLSGWSLPSKACVQDLHGWQMLIKKYGKPALVCFQLADKIERQNIAPNGKPKAPVDLKVAQQHYRRCEYTRVSENLSFADLCLKYHVPEKRFNLCLAYLAEGAGWPKKLTDNIPEVAVWSDEPLPQYVIVKLPAGDKRGLILGNILGCCQSIGGKGEACVKDASSLSDNGIYVLLERKNKAPGKQPIIAGEVNDEDFQIVGQAYAWRGVTGNLCLDSIECLNRVSHELIGKMFTKLARACMGQDGISRVTTGQSEKSPKGLYVKTHVTEVMRQGTMYADSENQDLIYDACLGKPDTQEALRQRILENLPAVLSHRLADTPTAVVESLYYFRIFIAAQRDAILLSDLLDLKTDCIQALTAMDAIAIYQLKDAEGKHYLMPQELLHFEADKIQALTSKLCRHVYQLKNVEGKALLTPQELVMFDAKKIRALTSKLAANAYQLKNMAGKALFSPQDLFAFSAEKIQLLTSWSALDLYVKTLLTPCKLGVLDITKIRFLLSPQAKRCYMPGEDGVAPRMPVEEVFDLLATSELSTVQTLLTTSAADLSSAALTFGSRLCFDEAAGKIPSGKEVECQSKAQYH